MNNKRFPEKDYDLWCEDYKKCLSSQKIFEKYNYPGGPSLSLIKKVVRERNLARTLSEAQTGRIPWNKGKTGFVVWNSGMAGFLPKAKRPFGKKLKFFSEQKHEIILIPLPLKVKNLLLKEFLEQRKTKIKFLIPFDSKTEKVMASTVIERTMKICYTLLR